MNVKPLRKTIHRNNENAQDRARRAPAAPEGAESERENGRKRGTMFYDHSLPSHMWPLLGPLPALPHCLVVNPHTAIDGKTDGINLECPQKVQTTHGLRNEIQLMSDLA
jgi:hypothetical protein